MIKLIIFDVDGVLISSKNLHKESLNQALCKISNRFVITDNEHLSIYDGLSTTRKLQLLTEHKGLEAKYYDEIWRTKQDITIELLKKTKQSEKLISIFKLLKESGYKIAVASNAIRETVKIILLRLGIMEYVDLYLSNEDVKNVKPFPEIYWKCMTLLRVLPRETLIIEDSHIGRQSVIDSGCNLLAVENPNDVIISKILERIAEVDNMEKVVNVPWVDSKLNVLIPMAGKGNRFVQAGYTFPKPLIDVRGKPMIQMVIDNLNIDANYIFLVLKEHIEKYNIIHMLKLLKPNCKIVVVDKITEGSACTTLLAKKFINTDNSLLMANCDQFLVWNSNEVMYSFKNDAIDGGMVTFTSTHPKWSYAKLNEEGFIEQVAEKDPISNHSNTGVMFWLKGSDYVKYAEQMIEENYRVNNEFYTTPVYNFAIKDGKRFKIKHIDKFWGTGTPEDLNSFLNEYKGDI